MVASSIAVTQIIVLSSFDVAQQNALLECLMSATCHSQICIFNLGFCGIELPPIPNGIIIIYSDFGKKEFSDKNLSLP